MAAPRRERGDRVARLRRPPGRAHGGGGEHGERTQPRRLHAVQLLSLAGARLAAHLVQERALSLARGQRPARRARRLRRDPARNDGDPRLGLDRRSALPRHPRAPARHRRTRRNRARRTRWPRFDDRHGPGSKAMSYTTHAALGGQPGHGPVRPEPEGELFHAAWELRVLALTLAMGATGSWNIDMSRAARETLPDYAASSYYEIWFEALQRLVEERGLASAAEIASGHMRTSPRPVARVLRGADAAAVLARGSPTERSA